MMSKNETLFIRSMFLFFTSAALHAEIPVGLLVGIVNNSDMRLLYQNKPIRCQPFGIKTLENLQNTNPSQECKTAVETYYRSNPHDRVFAQERLHLQQSYHFELIKEGCILYANGSESYSEMVLKKGMAVVDEKFDNKEWNEKLRRAQRGAATQKKGLFDTEIVKNCIGEEKK